jgi:membrane protease YdiL (CAAX protease family)/ribosomal protein S18 acetylase RimI-like enzyme
MVELRKAHESDVADLTETQIRTFMHDNKLKPPGFSSEGPPGYDSSDWNLHWIKNTPYYKILFDKKIAGGLIIFIKDDDHFEVGRIWVDPDFQNQGIGQRAMRLMFDLHPDVKKWTLRTPSWTISNQHFYEKAGFVRIRETEIDPNLGWSGIEYELVRDYENGIVRPIKLWQSLLFFLIPGLYGVFAFYVLFPLLVRFGMPEEFAYGTQMLSVFLLLFIATIICLRRDGWSLSWVTVRDRLRIRRMDSIAWKWTLIFLFLNLLLGYLFNLIGLFVVEKLGFWPPDADIPLTSIPFLILVLGINILAEELWWRGYILPRQELEHGKFAFLVNGILWSLFHMFKWWAVPMMLFRNWMEPFVVQRTKNTTPAIIMHGISNGISVLLSIVALLSQ